MSVKINYKRIIDDIENSPKDTYILTQEKAKKLINQELPKSVFIESYIKNNSNELARYLTQVGNYEVCEPKIIIRKSRTINK